MRCRRGIRLGVWVEGRALRGEWVGDQESSRLSLRATEWKGIGFLKVEELSSGDAYSSSSGRQQ